MQHNSMDALPKEGLPDPLLPIREKRLAARMGLEEMAWLLGLHHANLSKIEREIKPEGDTYLRLPTIQQVLFVDALLLLEKHGLVREFMGRVDEIRQVKTPLVSQPKVISKILRNGG